MSVRGNLLKKATKAGIVFTGALLLTACAGKPAPLSAPQSIEREPSFVTAYPLAPDRSKDARDMQSLIDEADRIVTSDAFARNLALVQHDIALSPFGERVTPQTVLTLFLGSDPAYSYVPTQIQWVDNGGNTNRGLGSTSVISLTRQVQDRWNASDVTTRSLAINTMAHELSHSLSHRQDALDYVFIDRFFSLYFLHRSKAIASYTIGTVAQCTWLSEQLPGLILQECYETYGLRKFNA